MSKCSIQEYITTLNRSHLCPYSSLCCNTITKTVLIKSAKNLLYISGARLLRLLCAWSLEIIPGGCFGVYAAAIEMRWVCYDSINWPPSDTHASRAINTLIAATFYAVMMGINMCNIYIYIQVHKRVFVGKCRLCEAKVHQ